MTPKEKAYELRQQAATKTEEAAEIIKRAEKENRALTADEDRAHKGLTDEVFEIRKRVSQMERQIAVDNLGYEKHPEERQSDPLPHEDPGNTRNGKHRFSLMKAIREEADRKQNRGAGLSGLERETSDEIAKRSDKQPQGFYMPLGNSRPGPRDRQGMRSSERRSLDSVLAGAGSVPTILDKDYIEFLRNKMVVMAAGAREIKGLHGKFAIPRQSGIATSYWIPEGTPATGSNQTLDQVLFTPHTIGAFTDVTRRFFELSNLDGEEFVMDDLTAILARGIDLAALDGSGTANQPLGILQDSFVTESNIVSLGANGGAPTWAACVELETVVARGNADIGDLAYVTNADGRGTMKTTPKNATAGYPVYLWENNEVNGYPAYATQQLPNTFAKGNGTGLSPVIFANWKDLIIAYWSGLDILVDPYTGSSSGTVRIVALQDCDVQRRHYQSFAAIVDLQSNQTQ